MGSSPARATPSAVRLLYQLCVAYVAVSLARKRLVKLHMLAEVSVETVKELPDAGGERVRHAAGSGGALSGDEESPAGDDTGDGTGYSTGDCANQADDATATALKELELTALLLTSVSELDTIPCATIPCGC